MQLVLNILSRQPDHTLIVGLNNQQSGLGGLDSLYFVQVHTFPTTSNSASQNPSADGFVIMNSNSSLQ